MLRLPRARGPHSALPENQPTISPSAMWRAVARNELFIGQLGDAEAGCEEMPLFHGAANLRSVVTGAPGCVAHFETAGMSKELVPNIKSGSDGEARIARRGLHENSLERHAVKYFGVGYAVECHAAGEAERLLTRLLVHSAYCVE